MTEKLLLLSVAFGIAYVVSNRTALLVLQLFLFIAAFFIMFTGR